MIWWHHGGWGAGQWLAMSLMMVVFWGAFVALVVWLVRSARYDNRPHSTGPPSSHADEILAERYARGEIDDEEYARRRRVLDDGQVRR